MRWPIPTCITTGTRPQAALCMPQRTGTKSFGGKNRILCIIACPELMRPGVMIVHLTARFWGLRRTWRSMTTAICRAPAVRHATEVDTVGTPEIHRCLARRRDPEDNFGDRVAAAALLPASIVARDMTRS